MIGCALASDANKLLVEITRCPVATDCIISLRSQHSCAEVVLHQWPGVPVEERRARWRAEHHVPEPWVGHIEHAPLLFLSSNPSVSGTRPRNSPPAGATAPFPHSPEVANDHPAVRQGLQAPRPVWKTDELVDRFNAAFDLWMPDGVRQISTDGRLGQSVPYWRAVKKLAVELFDRDVVPGTDYALTEVVHCKSQREVGVADAAKECIPRYLRKVLALSPAAVIVVLGTHARNGLRSEFNYPDAGIVSPPIEVAGRLRRIVFLANPGARGSTKYPRRPTGNDLDVVREWLVEAERAQKYTWEADDVTITRLPPRMNQPDL